MPNDSVTKKVIVVDASIARASGREEAVHPTATNCHRFLSTMLRLMFRVVTSPDMEQERLRRSSRFFSRWFTEMTRRNLVLDVGNVADAQLREKILQATKQPGTRIAIQKDFLLLEAALATDQTVASLDEKIRKHFRQAAVYVEEIETLVWINLDKDAEDCIAWLENGAPNEKERQLG